MTGVWVRLALLSLGGASLAAQSTTILEPGMRLVYESNGQPGAPWVIEAVDRDLAIAGRTGCLRVRFAPGGPREGPEVRVTCEEDGMLLALDTVSGNWRRTRPLRGAGMMLNVPGARGRVTRYLTGAERDLTLDGFTLRAIETTVLTLDSAGVAIRRLREQFAPVIGTATWGAFEVPDSSGGGWRVQQEFRLVAIRRP